MTQPGFTDVYIVSLCSCLSEEIATPLVYLHNVVSIPLSTVYRLANRCNQLLPERHYHILLLHGGSVRQQHLWLLNPCVHFLICPVLQIKVQSVRLISKCCYYSNMLKHSVHKNFTRTVEKTRHCRVRSCGENIAASCSC